MAIRVTGLNSGMDTDAMVQELVKAYSTKKDSITKQQTKLQWKQEAWKDLNTKIYNFYTNQLSNMRMLSSYSMKKTTSSDETKVKVSAGANAAVGTQKIKVKELAQSAYLTGSKVETRSGDTATSKSTLSSLGMSHSTILKVKIGGEEQRLTIDGSETVGDLVKSLREMGLNASFDEKNQRFFVSAKETGAENDFEFVADGNTDDTLKALGLFSTEQGGEAIQLKGMDAEIELNGATFTSKSNNFTINGTTISVLEKTRDKEISLTTSVDSQAIYDKIKDFFSEYNKLINEIDSLYKADSAKGYEPLTDEEKDAMTDTEVDKWEKKIKDALLRRDQTLDGVANTLKTALAKSFTINGKSYSLSSFGISTQSYFAAADKEKNAFHIDGDKDDPITKSNSDKLMAAINADPDTVSEFFSQLMKGTYEALDKKMKSTSLSSAYTVYNDKQIKSELEEYDKKLKDWDKKIKYYEDFYTKKFTAMEKAMASLQSSQNSLSQLLG